MLIRLFRSLRAGQPSRTQQEAEKKLSKFERAKLALKRLQKTSSFDAIKASQIFVQCTDKNIVEFADRIARYTRTMHGRESITPNMCFGELQTVSLDEFFTTNEGMYVSQQMLQVLCSQVEVLFDSIEASKARDDDNAAYAERLLSKTFTTVISLQEAIAQAV